MPWAAYIYLLSVLAFFSDLVFRKPNYYQCGINQMNFNMEVFHFKLLWFQSLIGTETSGTLAVTSSVIAILFFFFFGKGSVD